METIKLLKTCFSQVSYVKRYMRIPTKSGNFILSCVAGASFYCSPREDGLAEYDAVELGIFDAQGNWANCEDLTGAFKILEQKGECEYGGQPVFGWVSWENIAELYETL
jgi:hypothetical protein